MMSLLGYLIAWQELGVDLQLTVFASRPPVFEAVRATCPGIEVVPFAVGQPSWRHFLLQQTRLNRQIMQRSPDLLLGSQYRVENCPLPQVVRHQNLLRYLYPNIWGRLRRCTRYDLREGVIDVAARRALRRAEVNIFISEYMRREAEAIIPESAPRNHVIHNGLSRRVLDASRIATSTWDGQPRLLAIQDTLPHKDCTTLIRTLAELVRLRPSVPWQLEIAGGGDWTEYMALAERLRVRDRITLHGYVDHDRLDTLLRASLCLVFTSLVEGFGNPPIESMARRCPVIACNCTAMPEVIGEAGVLVPPGDALAFAESVIELYEDRAKRQRLVEAGMERIKLFDWHKSAMTLFGLFEKALA